ncbi:MAG: ATP-binding protein [Bacteroidales bacterium]|nr:ATP-binding protein [Bacteroidales bacterium]MDD4030699.1 ATP-binding protein [Bacteroidales bacterium]MDD4436023.1 ATP-binding protein [Bacteroidales bacterium]MDD5733182.1 ATP-binding protein [Bacteroidales bacterium]
MKRTLELENQLSALSGLLDMTGDFLDVHKVPAPVQYKIKLILDEIFSNIVTYGYRPQDPPDTVLVELCIANGTFTAKVNDGGIPFNPLEYRPTDTSLPLEERPIGGLGIHLVRNLSAKLAYERKENRNVFCFSLEIG